ncbi:MAG: methyltransferase domain-containing protein [Pseudomonadota bacterium]
MDGGHTGTGHTGTGHTGTGHTGTAARASYHDWVRHDVLPLVPSMGGTLLDFGGGVGATASEVKARGLVERIGVIDQIDPQSDGPPLDFHITGDVEQPQLIKHAIDEHGPFSTILCLDVLEHLRDPWSVVKHLQTGLTPEGVMIASIPNVRNYQALFPLLFHNQWTLTDAGILDRTHLRFFVRDTAIELMTPPGLMLEEIQPSASGGKKIRLLRAFTLGLFNSFTDRQYIIRVRASGSPSSD